MTLKKGPKPTVKAIRKHPIKQHWSIAYYSSQVFTNLLRYLPVSFVYIDEILKIQHRHIMLKTLQCLKKRFHKPSVLTVMTSMRLENK